MKTRIAAALVASATLAAATLTAGQAAASPGALVGTIAHKVADKALGFAVSQALGSVVGSGPVDLSEQAFQRIGSLVTHAVEAGRFADWKVEFESVVNRAGRHDGDLDRGIAIVDDAERVSIAMEGFGLQGVPSYQLSTALEMRFLEDIALIFDGSDPVTADRYRMDRSVTAHAALVHLRDMEIVWSGIASGRYTVRQKVISRWGNYRDGGASMRVCLDGPSGEWCSPSAFSSTWWVGGSRMTDSRPAYAEANAERDRLLAIDKAAIFGDLATTKSFLSRVAGAALCPLGDFDGSNCFVEYVPAGTQGFIHAGGLYTTPRMNPSCPDGDFDGANCVIARPAAGTSPFMHAGSLYTTPYRGPSCPNGSFDGANCFIARVPGGTSPFIYAGSLYTTPQPGGHCPIGWFDGANCYVATPEAGTSPFIYVGGLYTTPVYTPTCPIGSFDGANCFVHTPAAGTAPFIHAGALYTTPVRTPSCPVGSYDGANCFVAQPAAGTEPFLYAGGLYTTPVRR